MDKLLELRFKAWQASGKLLGDETDRLKSEFDHWERVVNRAQKTADYTGNVRPEFEAARELQRLGDEHKQHSERLAHWQREGRQLERDLLEASVAEHAAKAAAKEAAQRRRTKELAQRLRTSGAGLTWRGHDSSRWS